MKKEKRALSKCVNCKEEVSGEQRKNPVCPKCGKRWAGTFIKPDPTAAK